MEGKKLFFMHNKEEQSQELVDKKQLIDFERLKTNKESAEEKSLPEMGKFEQEEDELISLSQQKYGLDENVHAFSNLLKEIEDKALNLSKKEFVFTF